jgi:hypothetical protein
MKDLNIELNVLVALQYKRLIPPKHEMPIARMCRLGTLSFAFEKLKCGLKCGRR